MGPPKGRGKKVKNNYITKRAEFLKIGENIKILKSSEVVHNCVPRF